MTYLYEKVRSLTKKDSFWKYACIATFLLANILYLCLALQKNFHYDEAYSVGMIQNSFGDIIDITAQDVHSPFYYFALKLFCMLPGVNVLTGSKLFSWLFMLCYMIVGGVIVRKRYDWKICFYWMLLSGFVPSMMIQATTVRMYTMGLFLVTTASYLAYSLYEQESRKKWILFTLFSIVAVYVHTFCMLEMVAVYGIFVIMTLYKKRYKMLGKAFLSGCVVAVSFLPWLFSLWKQFARLAGLESGWQVNFEEVTLNSAITYLSEWFSSMEKPVPLAVLFGTALVIYVSHYTRKYVEEKKDYFPYLGMLLAGIVLMVGILVSVYVNPCFMGRYLFPLFGGVWLFVAIGIAKSGNGLKQAVMIVLVLYFGLSAFREEMRLEDSSGLNTYIEYVAQESEAEPPVIMADRYFTLMLSIFYPELDYMVYGYAPECLPFGEVEVFREWEQLNGRDTVLFVSFADSPGGNISEYFEAEETFIFDYSYYKIKVEKMVRK